MQAERGKKQGEGEGEGGRNVKRARDWQAEQNQREGLILGERLGEFNYSKEREARGERNEDNFSSVKSLGWVLYNFIWCIHKYQPCPICDISNQMLCCLDFCTL